MYHPVLIGNLMNEIDTFIADHDELLKRLKEIYPFENLLRDEPEIRVQIREIFKNDGYREKVTPRLESLSKLLFDFLSYINNSYSETHFNLRALIYSHDFYGEMLEDDDPDAFFAIYEFEAKKFLWRWSVDEMAEEIIGQQSDLNQQGNEYWSEFYTKIYTNIDQEELKKSLDNITGNP